MSRLVNTFLFLVSLAAAQPKPEGWPIGARIPAISGRVVDAITGMPIAGVNVNLRAKLQGESKLLRNENELSSRDGRFSFPTSLDPRPPLH